MSNNKPPIRTIACATRRLAMLALALALPVAAAQSPPYAAITVTAPQPEQTIHDNQGNVTVQVQLAPPLRVTAGDAFRVQLER